MEPFHVGPLAVWKEESKTQSAKARVLLIHGINEHSGRHVNTFQHLNTLGIEVVRFDSRGAGLSGGRRQWIESFQDYVDDAIHVLHWIQSTQKELPLFVLGHSLGGAIATYFASQYSKSLSGCILSAPAYKVGNAVSPLLIKVSDFLKLLAPGFRVPKAGDPTAISRDPRAIEEYVRDPLACHFNTIQQATAVLKAIKEVPITASKIHCPVLIAHGTHDRIILAAGSFEILQSLKTNDKTLLFFPGGYHELHNDLEKNEYLTQVGLWILKHLPA